MRHIYPYVVSMTIGGITIMTIGLFADPVLKIRIPDTLVVVAGFAAVVVANVVAAVALLAGKRSKAQNYHVIIDVPIRGLIMGGAIMIMKIVIRLAQKMVV